MCLFNKRKNQPTKERFFTMEEIRERIDEENQVAERLLDWEAEQIATGNVEKLFKLQAAIMADVEEIFGKKEH